MKIPLAMMMLKDKTHNTYISAYKELKHIFESYDKYFKSFKLLTDNEINLYECFFIVFQDSLISHCLCKKHYVDNLTRKLTKIGKTTLISRKGKFYHEKFHIFFNQVQLIVLLPESLIVVMKNYLIEKIELENIEGIEPFFDYLNRTIINKVSHKMSFFKRILESTHYEPQTSNSAESQNGRLNQYIFSLSRSRKLNTIVRSLRCFLITDYRRQETQFKAKKSNYRPSSSAIDHYLRAKLFVEKVLKIGVYPSRRYLSKIAALMRPDYFYGPLNSPQ